MRYLKIYENYSKPAYISPGEEFKNNESGEIFVVKGNGLYSISYYDKENPEEIIRAKTKDFLENFTKIEINDREEPVKSDNYDNYGVTNDLDFNKATYLEHEKAVIAAYMITGETDKSIELLNIKEFYNENGAFMDNANAYSVAIFKERLPKSQIEIISKVKGKEAFSYIKIPYWLYKENPNLSILKCKLNFNKKRIALKDNNFKDEELMAWFKDPDVEKYFKYSDDDKITQDNIQKYKVYRRK